MIGEFAIWLILLLGSFARRTQSCACI